MEQVTQEQGQIILIAINKIACSLTALNSDQSTMSDAEIVAHVNKWTKVSRDAVQELQSVGVPIN